MRIVFMGTPEFSLPALKRLIASDHEVVAVYTQPDKPVGRSKQPVAPPAKLVALENGLPVFQPEALKGDHGLERLIGLAPDLIVVVAFGRMLSQQVLDVPKYGCLNIHPSLLPKYRGASPVASAILNGDDETGVTIMLLDTGMDSGPVISRIKIPIISEDTTKNLTEKLADLGAGLLWDTLPGWVDGSLKPRPQDDEAATYTSTISKGDGVIDWNLTATDIWRRLRAFHPWPGCHTHWRGKTIKIIEAIPLPIEEKLEPGLVIELPFLADVPMGVVAGEDVLGVLTLQMEGRRAVSAVDFLRGQRDFIGQKLG